ncbi:pilus assembly protein FlpE [Cellulomonas sp. ACRRI]|uniref:pilus assembly protein FlpE n=1 Tax=Cellulomonas sp. ACRRI TaxID=2918188 RepID=UPI001EF28B98|nr:pilus assembly protein FlpE [Cellulomonas sp. ACRRI]MCG7286233.1 pilus assembly protein FlpE [Cellulomonas sp. ACRRI]
MARGERPAGGAGVVGVVGARGGAGATVTAAVLAAELARRGTAVLVDTGPGPSLDTVLGLEAHPGLRWPDLGGARGAVDPALLAGNLMRWGRCAVLPTDDTRPGPPPAAALADVLRALRAAHGSVVLDLDRAAVLGGARGDPGPSGAGDAAVEGGPPTASPGGPPREDARGSTLLAACSTVLVVVPRDVPAVAGARLLRDGLVGDGRRVGLVARGPAPGGLGVEEVAAAVGLPVVAALPRARGLGAAVDSGVGPALSSAAARAVARLARRLA